MPGHDERVLIAGFDVKLSQYCLNPAKLVERIEQRRRLAAD
jgi:hypothetical protein